MNQPNNNKGYAVCDIINGFRLGPAYLAHGIATFTVVAIFNENNASHILTPMLIMEVSTIVLAMLRANFFTPLMQLISQATFALLFFVCRIIISPMVHYDISLNMVNSTKMGDCFPALIFYTTIIFGLFFHGLNAFCKLFICRFIIIIFSLCMTSIQLKFNYLFCHFIFFPMIHVTFFINFASFRVCKITQKDQTQTHKRGGFGNERFKRRMNE